MTLSLATWLAHTFDEPASLLLANQVESGLAQHGLIDWYDPHPMKDNDEAIASTVTLNLGCGDWVEVDLTLQRLWPTGTGGSVAPSPTIVSVEVDLSVACWCPIDHNRHTIESRAYEVGSLAALKTSFELVLETLDRWAESEPSHSDSLRTKAGLPTAVESSSSGGRNPRGPENPAT